MAAGTMSPFGGIGVGCGINWAEDVSYGGNISTFHLPFSLTPSNHDSYLYTNTSKKSPGGLQAGSDFFGLEGGYTITNTSMEIGAGMGFTQPNASASLNFGGNANGTFEMEFSSSTPFECTQETKDGVQTMKCSYV